MPADREALLQKLVNEGRLLWDGTDLGGRRRHSDITWPTNYAALLKYKELRGHCNLTKSASFRCTLKGPNDEDIPYAGPLGKWLSDQKQLVAEGIARRGLTDDRMALLKALVDDGSLNWPDVVFPVILQVPATGTASADSTFIDDEDDDDEEEGLKADSGEAYKELTTPPKCDDPDWWRHYQALLHYYQTFGHCNVPPDFFYECTVTMPDGEEVAYHDTLGEWLSIERMIYDKSILPSAAHASHASATAHTADIRGPSSSSSSTSHHVRPAVTASTTIPDLISPIQPAATPITSSYAFLSPSYDASSSSRSSGAVPPLHSFTVVEGEEYNWPTDEVSFDLFTPVQGYPLSSSSCGGGVATLAGSHRTPLEQQQAYVGRSSSSSSGDLAPVLTQEVYEQGRMELFRELVERG